MKVTIKVDENGEHYLDVNDFKDIVDVEKVEYYKIEVIENTGALVVEFYDKDKNIVKPKGSV